MLLTFDILFHLLSNSHAFGTMNFVSSATHLITSHRISLRSHARRPFLPAVGEAAVGKSSVVLRFVQNDFQENKEPTIGAAFLTVSFNTPALVIWCMTAGKTSLLIRS